MNTCGLTAGSDTTRRPSATRGNVDIGVAPGEQMRAHLDEVRRTRLIINRMDQWLYDRIKADMGQRLMEIGSGHGNFLRFVADRELVLATDYEPSAVEVVRKRFADRPNIQTRALDICGQIDPALAGYNFDTVYSINTFEHIQDDRLALKNCAKILGRQGTLITVVPAHMGAYGTMDASIGHYRRYTKRTMAERLLGAGLTPVKQFYMNVVGLIGWFVNGRLLDKATPPAGQLGLFNALVPVLRVTESMIRPPVGLSLVSVAKPDAGAAHA